MKNYIFKKFSYLFIVAIFCFGISGIANAQEVVECQETLYVCDGEGCPENSYEYISDAMDDACSEATILVAQGTYNEDISISDRANVYDITIQGGWDNDFETRSDDPSLTIVDADGGGSVFDIEGEGDVTIEGLTIQNGDASDGGGIFVDSYEGPSSLTLTNCTLNDNDAYYGGGIYVYSEDYPYTLTLTNCTLSGNTAVYDGGGIYVESDYSSFALILTGCTLSGNSANLDYGGGIYVESYDDEDMTLTLTDCTLSENTADYGGGGIYYYDNSSGSLALTDCTLSGNSAEYGGGIIAYTESGSLTLTGCALSGNSADEEGGGIGAGTYSGSLTLTNCTLNNNTASYNGGGIYAQSWFGGEVPAPQRMIEGALDEVGGTLTLTNNTITENNSEYYDGGGVYVGWGIDADIKNTIIWGNSADGDGNDVYVDYGATVNASYSDIGDVYDYDDVNDNGNDNNVERGEPRYYGDDETNISQDPLFQDSEYHLASDSPCVDAGTNDGAPGDDFEGDNRPFDGDGDGEPITDMGADEYTFVVPDDDGDDDDDDDDGGGGGEDDTVVEVSDCEYSVSPEEVSFTAEGGAGSVSISSVSGDPDEECSWTATSNNGWIFITSGSGSGDGTIEYEVYENTGESSRTHYIAITGDNSYTGTVTVTQDGATGGGGGGDDTVDTCTYSLSSTGESFTADSGTGSLSVTTDDNCYWTAVSNDIWIVITSGSTGIGGGTVEFSVLENTDSYPRTGTMTIAGETYTVTQSEGGGGGGIGNPLPDIQANGSDGPVILQQGEMLSVTVSLNPGERNGEDADWWIYATTPLFQTYWYTLDSGWVPSDTPIRVHGGPLFSLAPYTIAERSALPIGNYVINFEVDNNIDNFKDGTWTDSVEITIE